MGQLLDVANESISIFEFHHEVQLFEKMVDFGFHSGFSIHFNIFSMSFGLGLWS